MSDFDPSVWREVQEALYQRFVDRWTVDPLANPLTYRTPFWFDDEKASPPDGMWVRFSVKRMPGGQGTLGGPGRRKMDRAGRIFGQLFKPPGQGIGDLSDAGEFLAKGFENCRIKATHDIRFAAVEPGESGLVDKGRWVGLLVEGRFDYEEHN